MHVICEVTCCCRVPQAQYIYVCVCVYTYIHTYIKMCIFGIHIYESAIHKCVRVCVRGEYGFSSLLKQNKKAKICFVIYIAGFFFLNFFCYEVFAKQKKTEEPRLYYSRARMCVYYQGHASKS